MKLSLDLIDLRQTKNYASFLKTQGWIVERTDNTNYFIKKFPIIGSFLKIQRPKTINFKIIKKIEKKYRVFQTIIEPGLNFTVKGQDSDQTLLIREGFRLTKRPYLPSKTLYIDLSQSNSDIFRNFAKHCKYSIKRGEKLAINKSSSSIQVQKFHNAWKKCVNFNRYIPKLQNLLQIKKSFPGNNSLFLTSHNISGRIIGGAIFTISSHAKTNYTCHYLYGFTGNEGRTSLSQYSLLNYAILWAKRRGCKAFDFEGIYDSRFPDKSWLGFSHFKKQFGGSEIDFAGCYTRFRIFR